MNELPIKVGGIIFSKNKNQYEFLLLKRTPEDGDFWQSLTGTLHDGEKIKDCLLRELFEEVGINNPISISDEVCRYDWKKGDKTIIDLVFGVEIDRNSKITLCADEHSEYKWCNFDDAIKTLGRDNNKKAFFEFENIYINK